MRSKEPSECRSRPGGRSLRSMPLLAFRCCRLRVEASRHPRRSRRPFAPLHSRPTSIQRRLQIGCRRFEQPDQRFNVLPSGASAALSRSVFGVACGLLILFHRHLGSHVRSALGVLARLFLRDSLRPSGSLGCALCISQFGGDPVRVFLFGRTHLSRFRRFQPCGLPLGGRAPFAPDAVARILSNWACFALTAVCRRSAKPGSLRGISSISHCKAFV